MSAFHFWRTLRASVILAAALYAWLGASATADAACEQVNQVAFCDSQAEAITAAQAMCGNVHVGASKTYSIDLGGTLSRNNKIYRRQVNPRQLYNGSKIACLTQNPSGGFAVWVDGVLDTCGIAGGASFQEWHSSSTWPPNGATCHPFQGSSCNTITRVLSSPTSNGNGSYSFRAEVVFTGDACSGNPEPEVVPEEELGDGWKCNKDTGLCTDPDGNGKLCTFNPDGTRSACVSYKPGDGTEPAPTDPEEPNDPRDEGSASGGASCSGAPACSGDRIACATLWQQWKTRCAVEAMSGAVVGGLEDVKGAVEGVGSGSGGGGIGDGNCGAGDADCNGVADVLESPYDEGQAGEIGDAVVTDDGQTAFDAIDGSGFLGGGACPGIPVHTYMGRTFNFNSTICEIGDAFAALVLVIAYAMAAGIVARAASGG